MQSNVFFIPIEEFLPFQKFCTDLYVDVEESPKAKEILDCIQMALYESSKTVLRPIPNRFNQMLAISTRIIDLWEALTVYYSAFLDEQERRKFRPMINEIIEKNNVSNEHKSQINSHLKNLNEQAKSNTNCDRKSRIIHLLFDKNALTFVIANLYKGLLNKFEKFIKLFQSSKPLVHLLHVELFGIMRDFFSFFIEPQHIPSHDSKKLTTLDYTNPDLHVKRINLFLGEFCKPLIVIHMKNKPSNLWLDAFFSSVKRGYLACAVGMMKLPVTNEVITELSCLSPGLQRTASTGPCLMKLAERLPNVIRKEDLGKLDEEVKSYCVDGDISLIDVDDQDKDFRLDTSYWSQIFKLRKSNGDSRYPVLGKLVKAVISIFCGPLVEASFNIMDDIMRKDRSKLTTTNYESLAMTKSDIMAKQKTATNIVITAKMKAAVTTAYARYQASLAKPAQTDTTPKPTHTLSNQVQKTSDIVSEESCEKERPCSKRKQPTIGSFFAKKQKTQ